MIIALFIAVFQLFDVKDIIEKTAVYHTVIGDPALFHTSKTAKMIKGYIT